ncbi:rhomboid-related protein [Holotrichia oblita]|uniref:Rhomboid-related protein n=1 Tax=Holotrichia oblita TaxID=644536 RepID=A0ACB9T1V3_HOLOL|nr:rhomboid-related protein [Holotrichia oblita]
MPLLQKDMIDPEKNKFLPPVITTPSSLTSDNRFLLPLHENKEKELPLYVKYKPPYAILTASILEVRALGAACISPDYVIGASAGVYALLISHMSDLLLNFKSIRYKKTRCISVGVIVTSDVIYNAVHFYNNSAPSISWGAHVFGALAGLLFGLVIYKTYRNIDKPFSNVLFYAGVVSSIITLLFLIAICIQVKRCTPVNMIHVKYTYIC